MSAIAKPPRLWPKGGPGSGVRLVWLVAVSGFSALVVAAFSAPGEVAGHRGLVLSFAVWLLLACFLLRRNRAARWSAVVLLGGCGTLVIAYPLADELQQLAMGRGLEWEPSLLVGLIFLADAVMLAFPDSTGDFFAEGNRSGAAASWEPVQVATGSLRRRVQTFQRDELLAALRRREIMIRRGRRITLAAVTLGWTICIGGVAWVSHQDAAATQQTIRKMDGELPGVKAGQPDSSELIGAAIIAQAGVTLESYFDMMGLVFEGYLVLFVLPFLLTLPFVFPFATGWRDPVRFLVLRPFNRDGATADLTRFLRHVVAPFGHCYTLSDRSVCVPLHIRVPLLLGQLSLFHFRARKIRRPRHLEKLVQSMRKRVRRSLNWCFSGSKLFPVSCCDPGWRACVARLAGEAEVIVADLSNITANVLWELELLRDAGALERTVLVVESSRAAQAAESIGLIAGAAAPPVVPYGAGSASAGRAVRACILDILCGAAGARAV